MARSDALLDEKAAVAPPKLYRDFTMRILTPDDGDGPDAEDAADASADAAPIAVAISSEAPVMRLDWNTGERYFEVLDHSTKNGPDLSYGADGLPFCLDHDLERQVGLMENLSLDSDRMLRGTLSQGNHPDASWVFADMRSGIRKKVSIGYLPGQTYTQKDAKQKGGIPTRTYHAWTLYEASSVTVPADYSVGVGRSLDVDPAVESPAAEGSAATASDVAPLTEAAATARTQETGMAVDNDTTADTRASALLADEKARTAELARIAKEHGQSERLADWIANGVSAKAASDEVMAAYRAKSTAAPIQAAAGISVGKEREEDKPYASIGEQLMDVVRAGRDGGRVTPQLRALRAASGQGEAMPADGGFALQPAFATEIQRVMFGGGNVLSRVRKLPVGDNSNSAKILALKENSRANGSRLGGIVSAYADEGDTISTSSVKTRTIELNLRKLVCAVPTSDELLADTVLLDSLVREIVPEEMRFRVEDAIINGTGAGQALGIVNSGALVSQAIEGSQTIANTNNYIWLNVAKMYSQMLPGSLGRAAWFVNPIVFAKILTATAGTGNPASPIFMPPGALKDSPFGAIYGLPVIPVEQCAAEGTPGDIILADMSQYLFIDKGGVNAAQSIHVRFLQDESVLRWTYRFDGAPALNTAVTPYKGSFSMSPFITLATRS